MQKRTKNKETMDYNKVKRSLIEALNEKGKPADFMLDKIDEYMTYWSIRRELEQALVDADVITTYDNGGGQTGQKVNDAIKELPKVSKVMASILEKLELNGVVEDETTPKL